MVTNQNATTEQRPARFGALAWTALILGIVGLVGSPILIFNNATAIAAGVGMVIGIIALFGTRKILAGIGTGLCVAAIAATLVAQQAAVDELDQQLGGGPALPVSAAPADTEQESGPATNDRGNVVKQLGEDAGLTSANDPDGPAALTFAIDRVEVDPACHEFGVKPESGHTLLLHVRAATGNDPDTAALAPAILNGSNFSEISSDGITRPAQMGNCSDYTNALPNTFGVNQKYAGIIEIVVPEASGTLVLSQPMSNSGGWEWTY